jgi:predicted nucleic acid-binding protein
MAFWLGLRQTPLRVEPVSGADLDRAQAIAEAWSEQAFDIVDCTSFAVMERLGCSRAATFDRDFLIYRFGPDRRRAFEVLR